MLAQINSPLLPLPLEQPSEEGHSLTLFQTVGVLLSLYSAHWQHDEQTIQQWLKRVMPFLQHQQARLFLTEDKTPYGFASWVAVPQAIHLQLLETATWAQLQPKLDDLLHQTTKPSSKNEPTYLWFVDLLTPFSHALAATQELKHHLSPHSQAWALNINQGQCVPRQVW
jgi:hemolysin-activating ACP:hemolysin acyltransferase